jgi:hypothetical protein
MSDDLNKRMQTVVEHAEKNADLHTTFVAGSETEDVQVTPAISFPSLNKKFKAITDEVNGFDDNAAVRLSETQAAQTSAAASEQEALTQLQRAEQGGGSGVQAITADTLGIANVAFIHDGGNDSTAAKGNPATAWKTMQAAYEANGYDNVVYFPIAASVETAQDLNLDIVGSLYMKTLRFCKGSVLRDVTDSIGGNGVARLTIENLRCRKYTNSGYGVFATNCDFDEVQTLQHLETGVGAPECNLGRSIVRKRFYFELGKTNYMNTASFQLYSSAIKVPVEVVFSTGISGSIMFQTIVEHSSYNGLTFTAETPYEINRYQTILNDARLRS